MSNLSTYYSFNSPDVNLNNQIVNWATGKPVYDASLNGAYISTFDYKMGNGSLEMPKNTFITPLPTATKSVTGLGTGNGNIEFSLSSDRLILIFCGYNNGTGSVYYKKRTTNGAAFSASVQFGSLGTGYYSMAMTPDTNYIVYVPLNGYIYYTKDPSFNLITGYNTFTRTLDETTRTYWGIAISADGMRIVVVSTTKVFFANWNGSNYNSLTETLETKIPTSANYNGISISSNGDRIVYGDGVNKNWYLSYWNGTNYNTGSLIYTSVAQTRQSYFNIDASILCLSYFNSYIQYFKYNKNSLLYDYVRDISNGNYDCHGLQCLDSSLNLSIFALAYNSGTINYIDLSYNTSSINYCNIKQPIINTSGLTIAFWFCSNYSPDYARIFDFSDLVDNSIRAVIFETFFRFVITINTANTTISDISGNYNNNIWYHVAITITYSAGTSSTVTVYINGLNKSLTTTNTYPNIITRPYCYLAKGYGVDVQFFGNIDDFRVYNSVLTQANITALYNTNAINNYTQSKIYLLYSTPVNSASTPITPNTSLTNVGTNKTYYYWNDPYAITNAIINRTNPYNFSYTYYNGDLLPQFPNAKVSIIINDLVTLKLNGSIILLNSGNTYLNPPTVTLESGNNLFEFITYNTGSTAYFAAYVVDSTNSNNYLFSTTSDMSGWNVMITGFYSNGYPISSLLVNNSTSTAYTTSTAITTATNYRTYNLDLSSNRLCKQIDTLDTNLKSNNNDLGNIFLSYP
jgi:hypothetical protein